MFRNPTTDLIVVLVIVLLVFGPKRLPQLGRQLGSGLREFKDSITGKEADEEERPALERASAPGEGAAAAQPEAAGSARQPPPNPASAGEHASTPGPGSAEVTSERRS